MIITGDDGKDRNTHRGMDADRNSVTFHNLTVTIAGARDAADAYDLLCIALGALEKQPGEKGAISTDTPPEGIGVEWTTDTYSEGDDELTHNVTELFPAEGSVRETKGRG